MKSFYYPLEMTPKIYFEKTEFHSVLPVRKDPDKYEFSLGYDVIMAPYSEIEVDMRIDVFFDQTSIKINHEKINLFVPFFESPEDQSLSEAFENISLLTRRRLLAVGNNPNSNQIFIKKKTPIFCLFIESI